MGSLEFADEIGVMSGRFHLLDGANVRSDPGGQFDLMFISGVQI
jgi:hypothetical protein